MIGYLLVAGLGNWVATLILVEAKIFERARRRVTGEYGRYFVECHLCTGTWVGIIMAVAFTLFAPYALPFHGWWMLLANALAIKAAGHMFLVLHKLGEAKADQAKNEAKVFTPVQVPGVEEMEELGQ